MNKKSLLEIDWMLITPVLVLLILGLVTIFSININLFKSQLLFSAVAIFAFFFFSRINYHVVKNYNFLIYAGSLLLLILVLIVGVESRGSVRWFEIFGFRIQFSELIKPFLVFSFASFLSTRDNKSFKNFFLSIFLLLPIAFLIFLQPDLGNALILVVVQFLILFIFGFPIKFFIFCFLILSSMLPIFWRFLHNYQRERLLTFFSLKNDPLGISYNAIQAIIAVGSGAFLGKGLGQGTQSVLKFLPERHTDFIFATLSEALGFIGSLLIVGAFFVLLYRIYLIYRETDDYFCKLFSISAFFLILVQFFINIGMNIGLLPIVGITLPFVSYGGSSLLSNFILLGLLSSIVKTSRNKDILEIR